MNGRIAGLTIVLLSLVLSGSPSNVYPQELAVASDPAGLTGTRSALEAAKQGEELLRKWDIAGAEARFRQAAEIDPASLEAAVGLAHVARLRLDYAGALSILDRAAARHSRSARLLAEYGYVYLAAEEPARAARYFDEALKLEQLGSAVVGRAGVNLLKREYKVSASKLREYLKRKPNNGDAHAMLARALLEQGRSAEASSAAVRALELNPHNTDAMYALAYVRATERKPDEVRALARLAVSLDPLNPSTRRLLSQYVDGRSGYNMNVSKEAAGHFEAGQDLRECGRLDEAAAEYEAALSIEPQFYRALIALGDIRLRQEDYERAAVAAGRAVEVDPEGALALLELSWAHFGLKERARIEIGAPDFAAMFYNRKPAAAQALSTTLFPNYGSLTRHQQIVIDSAVEPLARFLPRLAEAGARHYLLPFDRSPSEIGEFENVDGEKTFDGRYYASVRGVGGWVTVSGFEYLELAARGGFNTIAHEFAHQVHMIALGPEEKKAISRLYARAKREGRTLDYYAAANEFEYFAQGYEAFVSVRKRPSAGITARHTRGELLSRDPSLLRFIERLTGL